MTDAASNRAKLAAELLVTLQVTRLGRRIGFSRVAGLVDGGGESAAATARNRRRHKRFGKPTMLVQVGGMRYRTIDWSEGGLMVDGYDGKLRIGERVGVLLMLNQQECKAKVRVIRVSRGIRRLAVQFADLSPDASALLQRLRMMYHRAR